MSTQDSAASGNGIGFLPKLILWTLVIVFGALYLSSAKRHADESAAASAGAADAVAAQPAVPVGAGSGAQSAAGGESVGESGAAPVQAAESAAFARTLMDGQAPQAPEGERPAAADAAGQGVQGVHRLEAGVPAPDSNVARAVGAVPAVTAPVSLQTPAPTGPRVGAEPMAPVVPTAPVMPPRAMPAAPFAGGVPVAPVPPMQAPAVGESVSAVPAAAPVAGEGMERGERDRILAEYEAMRRAAEEQMRQQWQRMAVPAPYGYPGYAPAPYPAR